MADAAAAPPPAAATAPSSGAEPTAAETGRIRRRERLRLAGTLVIASNRVAAGQDAPQDAPPAATAAGTTTTDSSGGLQQSQSMAASSMDDRAARREQRRERLRARLESSTLMTTAPPPAAASAQPTAPAPQPAAAATTQPATTAAKTAAPAAQAAAVKKAPVKKVVKKKEPEPVKAPEPVKPKRRLKKKVHPPKPVADESLTVGERLSRAVGIQTGAGIPAGLHGLLYFIILSGFIILYANVTTYEATGEHMHRYAMFQDVHVMIFVGFGFLMCFLHRSGFTATSHAYLIAVFGLLWAILNRGFWKIAFGPDSNKASSWSKIPISLEYLVNADFAVGACLISMGAVLGRASALQLVVMATFEIVVYHINESILIYKYLITDIGGSMVIHTFGAYFGLACAFVLGKKGDHQEKSFADNKSDHITDTLAMLGSLFLFCFWPSFNGALAGPSGSAHVQQRAVVNTILGICASTFVAYAITVLVYKKKLRMVEIQNATLAGGVALGTAADMWTLPAGALIIGGFAGATSVFGYRFLSPALDTAIGLKDTCGIHNLHGMPGFIGGLAGVIVSRTMEGNNVQPYRNTTEVMPARGAGRDAQTQSLYQLAALATTLGIALVSGAIAGAMLLALPTLERFYHDDVEYVVEEEYEAPEYEDVPPNEGKRPTGHPQLVHPAPAAAQEAAAPIPV